MNEDLELLLPFTNSDFSTIVGKLINSERITSEEALLLYNSNDLAMLAAMATFVKKRASKDYVFYNRNFHLEPSNVCAHRCKFCSYVKPKNDPEAWDFSIEELVRSAVRHIEQNNAVTEVHIVGACHPDKDFQYYVDLIRAIRTVLPKRVHIKAFSAIELDYMFDKAQISIEEGLRALKDVGLRSIPGGGAEIFDSEIRNQICPTKTSAEKYLAIHRAAHRLGMKSNSTMLYGHLEKYEHRVDHLSRLRALQDSTGGFNAFIPLKFRSANNPLSHLGEVAVSEDMKNFAVSRIFLDNIPHIKAYWPMLGREMAQTALLFGADDLDGTIDDSTKIYSMAGSEQNPAMTTSELEKIIINAGFQPVERDSNYHPIRQDNVD